MKLIYTTLDRQELLLLQSYLESAGIICECRNDRLQGLPQISPADKVPELWIIDDEHLERAQSLLKDYFIKAVPALQHSWTCSKCGEEIEGQFSTCWNCAAEKD